MVNKKKLWSVQKLCNLGYEYVLTIDADFLFIKSVNLMEICKRFFEKKTIISNSLENEIFTRITRCCLSHFRNNEKSAKIDARIYSWLNQPCIYQGSTIGDFFDRIDIHDDFSAYLWEDFDYILYTYYLILYRGFKLYVIQNWPENMAPFSETHSFPINFDFGVMSDVDFFVCSREAYPEIQKYRPNNEIFIVVHMDR